MGYHEDCPDCGCQLPDEVSTSDGPCTDCLKKRIAELQKYTKHHKGCNSLYPASVEPGKEGDMTCDCGLADIEKEE